jgi:hypothetical protein
VQLKIVLKEETPSKGNARQSPNFVQRDSRAAQSPKSCVEHLRLLVGKDSIADALLRHFGSLKALSRAWPR